jgi:hypothetical protein
MKSSQQNLFHRLVEVEPAALGTARPQGGSRAAFGRTLLGRRHAGRGVGLDEELRGKGRFGRTAVLRPAGKLSGFRYNQILSNPASTDTQVNSVVHTIQ